MTWGGGGGGWLGVCVGTCLNQYLSTRRIQQIKLKYYIYLSKICISIIQHKGLIIY